MSYTIPSPEKTRIAIGKNKDADIRWQTMDLCDAMMKLQARVDRMEDEFAKSWKVGNPKKLRKSLIALGEALSDFKKGEAK